MMGKFFTYLFILLQFTDYIPDFILGIFNLKLKIKNLI